MNFIWYQVATKIDALLNSGAKVNTYVQSPYLGSFSNSQITSVEDYNDHRIHTIPTTFRNSNNEIAKTSTLLSDIFPEGVTQLNLSGISANDADNNPTNTNVNSTFTITPTSTIQDLMDSIENMYNAQPGANVEVEFSNGKITIIDNNVSKKTPPDQAQDTLPYIGESSLSLTITAQDAGGNNVNGFRNDYSVEYDRVGFSKNGSILSSNVSQVIRDTNEYATMDTKLSQVAGVGLDGHTYNFEVKDVNGTPISGRIEFRDTGSVMIIDSPATINGVDIDGIEIPILNPNGNPPQVASEATPADDVTYQQLADTLGMVLNLSNTNPADLQNVFDPAGANFDDPAIKLSYETMISNSKNNVSISLDVNGQMQVKDLNRTPTRMEFMLYDSESSNFALDANGRVNKTHHAALMIKAIIIAVVMLIPIDSYINTKTKLIKKGIQLPI